MTLTYAFSLFFMEVKHNRLERAKHLPKLIAAVRLGLIGRPNFRTKIMTHPLIQEYWNLCADHILCADQFLEVKLYNSICTTVVV